MRDRDRIVDEVRGALNGLLRVPGRDWTTGVKPSNISSFEVLLVEGARKCRN